MNLQNLSKILFSLSVFFMISQTLAFQMSASYANSDAGSGGNDTWTIEGSYIGTYFNPDSPSNRTPGKTLRTIEVSRIDSTLFGDLVFNNTLDLNFVGIDGKCGSDYTLSFSGSATSLYWGDFIIDKTKSFTCVSASTYSPMDNGSVTIVLSSGQIVDKTIGGAGGVSTINHAIINSNISINGIKKTLDSKYYNGENTTSALGAQSIKYIIKTNINKQLEILLRGKQGITTDTPITSLSTLKDTEYYNFEGSPAASSSNETNAGKILEIKHANNAWTSITANVLSVTGQKTIVVKGGNIYINADISNTDDNTSLLVLIAKRDSTNKKNGGNIYIHPNVTNIDAVLIADGSVLSYDSTNKTNLTPDQLRRQLLIYGQISSSNIINAGDVPYGSDAYIIGNKLYDPKYDIAKLRYFTLRPGIVGSACTNITKDVPAKAGVPYEYAWAGKKQCYSTGNGVTGLKTSSKINPVIVEKNGTVITNPPFILKTNTD